MSDVIIFFFFQAEDGIRDHCVTGVQTCALPILDARDLHCAGTMKVASVQPISPEENAIAIDRTPVSRSELCSTVSRYNQKRIAGPANGPSVRKLLHANATAPYSHRSGARVRVPRNAATS